MSYLSNDWRHHADKAVAAAVKTELAKYPGGAPATFADEIAAQTLVRMVERLLLQLEKKLATGDASVFLNSSRALRDFRKLAARVG
jgi:hypothetical protein